MGGEPPRSSAIAEQRGVHAFGVQSTRQGISDVNIRRICASAIVAAIVAAGCGSDNEESDSVETTTPTTVSAVTTAPVETAATTAATDTATTETASTDTAASTETSSTEASDDSGVLTLGSSCTGETPSGDPIKLAGLFENGESPVSGPPGGRAAIDAINACGGVNGRPLEYTECANGGDQNAALKCANDAVADEDVLAAGGVASSFGGLSNPVFEEAGMAVVGLIGPGSDATSPNFFGTALGTLITPAGAGYAVKELDGIETMGVPFYNIGNFGTAAVQTVTDLATGPAGLPDPVGAPVDPAEVNMPAKVAALGDVDVAVPALTPDLFVGFAKEARNAGFDYPFVFNTSVLSQADLAEGLPGFEGLHILSQFKLSGDGYDMYQEDMEAAGIAGTKFDNAQSIQTWLSIRLLADVIASLGPDASREGVLDALTNLEAYDTLDLTPVLDFTSKDTSRQFANVINPAVVYYTVENDKFVPVDGEVFHDDLIVIP